MAHTLSVYYEAEHADDPVIVRTTDEVTALIGTVREKYPEGSAVLLTVIISEDPWGQEFSVGIDGAKGVLRYAGGDHFKGVFSKNANDTNAQPVIYYYVTADTEFPANSEVPLNMVETALIEFLTTGGQLPTAVDWQQSSPADRES